MKELSLPQIQTYQGCFGCCLSILTAVIMQDYYSLFDVPKSYISSKLSDIEAQFSQMGRHCVALVEIQKQAEAADRICASSNYISQEALQTGMNDYTFYGSIQAQAISLFKSSPDLYQQRNPPNSSIHTPRYPPSMTHPSINHKRSFKATTSKYPNTPPRSQDQLAQSSQFASQASTQLERYHYQQLCRQCSIAKTRELELETLLSKVDSRRKEYVLLLQKLQKLSSENEQQKQQANQETIRSKTHSVLLNIRQSDRLIDDLIQAIEREKKLFQDRCKGEQETICQLQNQNKNTETRLQARKKQIQEAKQYFQQKQSLLQQLSYLQHTQETLQTKNRKLASLKQHTLSLMAGRKVSNGRLLQSNQSQSMSKYPIISPPASPRQSRQSSSMLFQCKKAKLQQKIWAIREQEEKRYVQYLRQVNSKYNPGVLQQVYYSRLKQKVAHKKQLQDFLKKRQNQFQQIERQKLGLQLCHPQIIQDIEYLKTDLMKIRAAFPDSLHSQLQRTKMFLEMRQQEADELQQQLHEEQERTQQLERCISKTQQEAKQLRNGRCSSRHSLDNSQLLKELGSYKQKSLSIEGSLKNLVPSRLIQEIRLKIGKQKGRLRQYDKLSEQNQRLKEELSIKRQQAQRDQWAQCYSIKEFESKIKKLKEIVQYLEEETKQKRKLNSHKQHKLQRLLNQETARNSMKSESKTDQEQVEDRKVRSCRNLKARVDRHSDESSDEQQKWIRYIKQSSKRNHKTLNIKNLRNQVKQYSSMIERTVDVPQQKKPKNHDIWFKRSVFIVVIGIVLLLIYR